MSDTPRTDAKVRLMIDNNHSPEGLEYWARDLERELNAANAEIERLKAGGCARDQRTTQFCAEAVELGRRLDETQAALDLSARQLLETVNDRNSLGVQLDLLRDELLRISARIGETGLIGEHPQLSSIADYCERAQKDISVRYTPIQERDSLKRELNEAQRNAARYEVVRKMNASDFANLLQRCLFQDLRFDDEVDRIGGLK